jgi:hypothetical protein
MKILKLFFLFTLVVSLGGCVIVPVEKDTYYSCGLVAEIDKVAEPKEYKDTLYIHNISEESIRSVKYVFTDATFDEADRDAEPDWSECDDRLSSRIPDGECAFCDLKPEDNLKTLWVRVDTLDRHCVFAVVYEAGSRIDVNIRKSDT